MEADGGRIIDEVLEGLCGEGLAVLDGYLGGAEVRALADCARQRRERGDFTEARIGADRDLKRRADIRGDSICWLAQGEFAAERALLESLETLRLRLNAGGLPGLFDLELHYAWYEAGAGYARHLDQPRNRSHRRVSLVLYLNEDWQGSDGGALRVFFTPAASGGAETHRDIVPVGGRLVAFLTEGREHTVLPAGRPRLSLTGWFRGREH